MIWWRTCIAICLLAILVGIVLDNPMLLSDYRGSRSHFMNSIGQDNTNHGYIIFTQHFVLDAEMENLRRHFSKGDDYQSYRNHCLRVLSFAKYFLPSHVYEVHPNAMNILAMALAYHDVGLWTDQQLNYLEPSFRRMEENVGKDQIFTLHHISIARDIIRYHHKVTNFHSSNKAVEAMVNAVRKADWADVTMGILRFGMPTDLLEMAYQKVPSYGFHQMLAGMSSRLSPHSFLGRLEVLKILKW
jgi:hypothetical protein